MYYICVIQISNKKYCRRAFYEGKKYDIYRWRRIYAFNRLWCNSSDYTSVCAGIYFRSGERKGDVDTEDFADRDTRFEIGADKDGNAVFKNPDAAYDALIVKYSDGISLIKEEYSLDNISKKNYGEYQTYGWQVTGGSDESREQAQFVSEFFDIYENSYK